MNQQFPVISRRQIIDALMAIRCSNKINKKISKTQFSYHEAFTDTEMATLWFQQFGEVVRVGNSRLHDILQEDLLIAQVTAEIFLKKLMQDSRQTPSPDATKKSL
jgi:hypothetical protein